MGDVVPLPPSPVEPADEPGTSMVMTRVNGTDYPLRSVRNCRTCQSPYRAYIENQIIHGVGWKGIAASLDGAPRGHMEHPSWEGIKTHNSRGHMPYPLEVRRRLIERRAEEIGLDIENAVEEAVDEVTVSRMIVRRGFERLVNGEIEPTIGDVVQASNFLLKVQQEQGENLDVSAYSQSIEVFFQTVMPYIPEDRRDEVSKALARNPVLKAIAARVNGEADIVDAELVE